MFNKLRDTFCEILVFWLVWILKSKKISISSWWRTRLSSALVFSDPEPPNTRYIPTYYFTRMDCVFFPVTPSKLIIIFNCFIFECLISSALCILPGPVPPSCISIVLSSFALGAVLLTISMNTFYASLLKPFWDYSIVFYSSGTPCNVGVLFPIWSYIYLSSLFFGGFSCQRIIIREVAVHIRSYGCSFFHCFINSISVLFFPMGRCILTL